MGQDLLLAVPRGAASPHHRPTPARLRPSRVSDPRAGTPRQDPYESGIKEIHFFGDKTYKGGNDYEIYESPKTIGHAVGCPADTLRICNELFFA